MLRYLRITCAYYGSFGADSLDKLLGTFDRLDLFGLVEGLSQSLGELGWILEPLDSNRKSCRVLMNIFFESMARGQREFLPLLLLFK